MRKDLLLELADFLEKLEPNRFDMRTWRKPTRSTVGYVSDEQLLTDSNTVACSIGWAATLSSWKDAGFYIGKFDITKEHLSHPLSTPYTMAIIKWKGNPNIDSYDAIQEGLDLPSGMAEVLFQQDNYADEGDTPSFVVAERIREFCNASEDELMDLILSYDEH